MEQGERTGGGGFWRGVLLGLGVAALALLGLALAFPPVPSVPPALAPEAAEAPAAPPAPEAARPAQPALAPAAPGGLLRGTGAETVAPGGSLPAGGTGPSLVPLE